MSEQSFNERQRLVQAALQEARGSTDVYVVELYDDHAVYEIYGDGSDAGRSFDVPYTIDADGTVTLGDRTEVVRQTTYQAVKFVKGSESLIEGLAIPFAGPRGGKDLDNEDFGADTDFAFDWFPQGRPVIYHHGLNGALKTTVQGRQHEHEMTDEGVFARAELDKSAKYHATVAKLVAQGKLFFSSGAVPHLVDVDDSGHIKRWPWVELSLTPTPANPYATVHAVKSTDLIDRLEAAKLPVPAQLIASALKALDASRSDTPDDDGLPDGLKFADHADRLLADVTAFRTRTGAIAGLRGKSGRVLSASTRERLIGHPVALRELAAEMDELISPIKSADLWEQLIQAEQTQARLLGVPVPAGGPS